MDTSKAKRIGIILLVVGLIEVLSPIDLIPDFVPYVGWVDDALGAVGGIAGLITIIVTGVKQHRQYVAD